MNHILKDGESLIIESNLVRRLSIDLTLNGDYHLLRTPQIEINFIGLSVRRLLLRGDAVKKGLLHVPLKSTTNSIYLHQLICQTAMAFFKHDLNITVGRCQSLVHICTD